MRRRMLASLCVALVAAGCGAAHPRPRLTHAAFVARANRVCAEASTHSARVSGLRALRPPKADSDLYNHWLAAERDALRAASARPDAAKKGKLDPAFTLAIAEGKVAGYAKRLGAATCAKRTIGTMPP